MVVKHRIMVGCLFVSSLFKSILVLPPNAIHDAQMSRMPNRTHTPQTNGRANDRSGRFANETRHNNKRKKVPVKRKRDGEWRCKEDESDCSCALLPCLVFVVGGRKMRD